MGKNSVSKLHRIGEAIVWALFVIVAGLGAMSLLNIVNLTSQAKAFVGYILGAYAALVFGYIAYRAVDKE